MVISLTDSLLNDTGALRETVAKRSIAFAAIRWRWCEKIYPRDNRVVPSESPHRPGILLPRCRLFLSWPRRRDQGCDCSPLNRKHEMGSIRRKTGCFLSMPSVGTLRATELQYERKKLWEPLVYRLSGRASPSSHAPSR